MTRDEIIEMAIQGHASTRDAIKWAMNQAAAKEREACAKMCETALYQLQETMNELSSSEYMEQCVVQGAMNQAVKLNRAIRARGEA